MLLSSGEDSKERGQVLHLTVPGTRELGSSGAALRFVESEGHIEILAPAEPLPRWAEALSATRTAVWRIGRKEFTGHATPIIGPDAEDVLTKFETEFGADGVRRWFGTSVQPFALCLLKPDGQTYRESVELYFDR